MGNVKTRSSDCGASSHFNSEPALLSQISSSDNAVVAQEWTLEDVPKLKLNHFLSTENGLHLFLVGTYIRLSDRTF